MITRKYEILIHFYTKRWHMQIDDTKLKNVQDPKNKIKIKIKIYKKIDTHKYNIKHSLDTKLQWVKCQIWLQLECRPNTMFLEHTQCRDKQTSYRKALFQNDDNL
jgi:hypothetical protein